MVMKNANLIRGSEAQDFLRCRKRWKWRWVDKLVPKRTDDKLLFGNLFHKFVEEYYKNGKCKTSGFVAMKSMFNEANVDTMEQTELDDLWELVSEVTENYVNYWSEKDDVSRVLATEFTFAIPLIHDIVFTGTVDLLYIDYDGKLCFKDYKTSNSPEKYVKRAKMDMQIRRYFWAIQQLLTGEGFILEGDDWKPVSEIEWFKGLPNKPDRFIYDIVARKAPKVPELLKKGGLSVNKSQDTTYSVYLKALIDHGLATKDGDAEPKYQEMLEHLLAQESQFGNKFFRRIPVYCHTEEIENSIQELFSVAVESSSIKKSIESGDIYKMSYDPIYRNVTDDCSWDCPFEGLCLSDMDGSDTESLIDMFFDVEDSQED